MATDAYTREFVFVPWGVAEFGDLQIARKYASQLIATHYFSAADLQNLQSGQVDPLQYITRSQRLVDQIKSENPSQKDWIDGKSAGRLAVVGLALVAAVVAGLLVFVLSAGVILAKLALAILVFLGPVFALAAVIPGWGQRVAMRWVEMMIGLFLQPVLLSALLSVVLVASGALVSGSAKYGWFMATFLQIALIVAIFVYRKQLLAVFAAGSGSSVLQAGPGIRESIARVRNARAIRRAVGRQGSRGPVGGIARGLVRGVRKLGRGGAAAGTVAAAVPIMGAAAVYRRMRRRGGGGASGPAAAHPTSPGPSPRGGPQLSPDDPVAAGPTPNARPRAPRLPRLPGRPEAPRLVRPAEPSRLGTVPDPPRLMPPAAGSTADLAPIPVPRRGGGAAVLIRPAPSRPTATPPLRRLSPVTSSRSGPQFEVTIVDAVVTPVPVPPTRGRKRR